MIYIILKSYLWILLGVLFGAVSLFVSGVYWVLKNSKPESKPKPHLPDLHLVKEHPKKILFDSSFNITVQDISAIAGDDIMTTQLDLARAYMEAGRKNLAKNILEHVVAHGSLIQQKEAGNLLKQFETS